jgi:hypothetical protein
MFDHIELGARLVIVGITPGAQQRDLADAAYAAALRRGLSQEEAARTAKFAASFGGAMRKNLIATLDHAGAARMLEIASTAALFDPSTRGLAHFTSALRYPVFIDGENYNGQVPMFGSPLLRTMIDTLLAAEASQLGNAIWQPLGEKPVAALAHLVERGIINADQIAPALPHPSGANAERIAYFLGRKPASELSTKTRADRIDALRNQLQAFYASHTSNGRA